MGQNNIFSVGQECGEDIPGFETLIGFLEVRMRLVDPAGEREPALLTRKLRGRQPENIHVVKVLTKGTGKPRDGNVGVCSRRLPVDTDHLQCVACMLDYRDVVSEKVSGRFERTECGFRTLVGCLFDSGPDTEPIQRAIIIDPKCSKEFVDCVPEENGGDE